MKNKSLSTNSIINGIKSLMSIIFPLITFPYVSRILQVNNLGKYNFALSLNSYFILIASLGISTYSIREGAKYRDHKEKMSQFASEIFTINIISTFIAYLLLFITIFFVPKLHAYIQLIIVFSIQIFFTTIGVNWIFSIYEEYKYIAIKTITFQILSLILLLIFVKKTDDYVIYAEITVLASIGSNFTNYFYSKKFCNIRFLMNCNLKRHIKAILVIFATTLATTIYVSSDTTILGLMTSDYNVGLYSVSAKVYTIIKMLLSSVLIVSIPRLSNYLGNNAIAKYNRTLIKIFKVMIVVVVPAVVGLFMISKQVVLIISDVTYLDATLSLRLLSIALFFSLFGWLFNSCVLIPYKREKDVLIATITSAILNVLLNIVLIPAWKENAAAFTTVLAEACSMFMCIYYSKDLVKITVIGKDIISIGLGCLGIISVCTLLNFFGLSIMLYTIFSVCLSALVYGIVLLLFKNEMIIAGMGLVIKHFNHISKRWI